MSQKTRATYKTTWSNSAGTFADNSTRQISEEDVRNFADDTTDSTVFKSDDYDYFIQGVTASGTDTYTITPTIPAAYTSGERFLVTFTNGNTGAATLNRNSLGAKDLLTQDGDALSVGQIVAGGIYLVQYNGTNYRVLNVLTTIITTNTNSYFFEDFIKQYTGSISASNFNNGGGAGASPTTSTYGLDGTEQATGVVQMSTSTSTGGGSALSNSSGIQLTFGFGFTYVLEMRCALSNLSDGSETYETRLGFMDSISTQASIVDGAYFRYTHGTNSGKWEAVTVSNSTETAEDTGVAAVDTNFVVFKIVCNADATQIDFYINGTKTNDITTNIINSSSRVTGYAMTIEKTVGSTARLLYSDYISLNAVRTTER